MSWYVPSVSKSFALMINTILVVRLLQNFWWPLLLLRQGNTGTCAKTLAPTQLSSAHWDAWRSRWSVMETLHQLSHQSTQMHQSERRKLPSPSELYSLQCGAVHTDLLFYANSQDSQGNYHLNHPDSKHTTGRFKNHKRKYCHHFLCQGFCFLNLCIVGYAFIISSECVVSMSIITTPLISHKIKTNDSWNNTDAKQNQSVLKGDVLEAGLRICTLKKAKSWSPDHWVRASRYCGVCLVHNGQCLSTMSKEGQLVTRRHRHGHHRLTDAWLCPFCI